jgi:uncharacterized phage protein (TIGR01671 family)
MTTQPRKAVSDMREILFRGKRIDNGEWLCGNLTVWDDGEASIDQEPTEGSLLYAVVPQTVGQYTGLTDKNGKKMFEGDVVAGAVHWLEMMKNGVITFRYGSFGLVWYRGCVEQFNPFTSMCNVEYEVVGNIHDNPELLEGE